jgi:hypothetical protein
MTVERASSVSCTRAAVAEQHGFDVAGIGRHRDDDVGVRGRVGSGRALDHVTVYHARRCARAAGESNPVTRLDQVFRHRAPHEGQTDKSDVQRPPQLSGARDLGRAVAYAAVL